MKLNDILATDKKGLNEALTGKLNRELNEYINKLKMRPPEEIVDAAYSIVERKDIISSVELNLLSAEQCRELLKTFDPLNDLAGAYEKADIQRYNEDVFPVIESYAESLVSKRHEALASPLYLESADYAERSNELDAYRLSAKGNRLCRMDFEQAINRFTNGDTLDADAVLASVREEHSDERINAVLAATVLRHGEKEDRISDSSREWAKSIPLPEDDIRKAALMLPVTHPAEIELCVAALTDREHKNIVDRSNDIVKIPSIPVYHHSAGYAREHNELDIYRLSNNINRALVEDLRDSVITHNDRPYHYDLASAIADVTAKYGEKRTASVLAASVMNREGDGRISNDVRNWAFRTLLTFDTDKRNRDVVSTADMHSTILDSCVNVFNSLTNPVQHEIVTIGNDVHRIPALISDIKTPQIPEGLFRYELRGDDNDPNVPATAEANVSVNRAGFLITAVPLLTDTDSFLELKGDNELNYTGETMSILQFRNDLQPPVVTDLHVASEQEKNVFDFSPAEMREAGGIAGAILDSGNTITFGSGTEPGIKNELDKVLSELSSAKFGNFFVNTNTIQEFCRNNENAQIRDSGMFAFRADTADKAYLLRFNSEEKDTSIHIFDKEKLDNTLYAAPQIVNAVIVEPGQKPREIAFDSNDDVSKLLGDKCLTTEIRQPFSDSTVMISDPNVLHTMQNFNRSFDTAEGSNSKVFGSFIIAGMENGRLVSLTDEQRDHFMDFFKSPQECVKNPETGRFTIRSITGKETEKTGKSKEMPEPAAEKHHRKSDIEL